VAPDCGTHMYVSRVSIQVAQTRGTNTYTYILPLTECWEHSWCWSCKSARYARPQKFPTYVSRFTWFEVRATRLISKIVTKEETTRECTVKGHLWRSARLDCLDLATIRREIISIYFYLRFISYYFGFLFFFQANAFSTTFSLFIYNWDFYIDK